jgi:PST family polysaccharide transporter
VWRRRIVRDVSSLYAIQLVGYVIPLVTYPYLARALHAEKLGLLIFAQAFSQYFVTLTDYGFNLSATREVAVNRDNPDSLARIFSAVMAAKAVLVSFSFLLMTGIVFATPKLRHTWPVLLLGFLRVLGYAALPVWLFQGLERMRFIKILELAVRIIGLLPLFFLVHRESDYLIAAGIQSGSMALAGIVGILCVSGATGVRFRAVTIEDVWCSIKDGRHVFLASSAVVLYSSSNTFLLGLVDTAQAVGLYSVAKKLTDATKSLVSPISAALFPRLSYLASKSARNLDVYIRRNLLAMTFPFIAITAVLMVAAPAAIHLFSGGGFAESVIILRIMAPIPCIASFAVAYSTYFMLGLGYQRECSRIIIQASAFNFVLLAPLLILFSPPVAFAITGTLVELFVLVRAYWFYRKHRTGEEDAI